MSLFPAEQKTVAALTLFTAGASAFMAPQAPVRR